MSEPTGYDHPYWKANPSEAETILEDALFGVVEDFLRAINLDAELLADREEDLRDIFRAVAAEAAEDELDEE